MEQNNYEYKIMIQETHLDFLGHVNNAKYLELYEQARWHLIENQGYGLDVIIKEQKSPVVLEANIKFKKEITNREIITIKTFGQWQKGKIMGLSQKMVNEKDEVCSEASFTIGFIDMKERKLITPDDSWLKACGIK